MIRDPMLLVNIQLAILGIVIVAGLFYLWRMVCRVEKRLDEYIAQNTMAMTAQSQYPSPVAGGSNMMDVDAETEAFMQEVFGVAAPIVINAPVQPHSTKVGGPSIQITEDEPTACDVDQDAQSIATTSTQLSKNKLKRMSVEALRDVCKEKGLPVEGTKPVLIERIVATIEDEE